MSARDYLVDAMRKPQYVQIRKCSYENVLAVVALFYKMIRGDRVFEPLALTFTKDHIIIFNRERTYWP
jgi:hypothetical protein